MIKVASSWIFVYFLFTGGAELLISEIEQVTYPLRYFQVVGVLEQEVPDLIEVPKPLEHASVVGDHLNFHLINPTPEENVAFQVMF